MIHRESRDELALALRRYVSGQMHNDELAEVDVDWRDRGAVYVSEMAWQLYDDTKQHYAKGKHSLDKQARRTISRWIVFLHSDIEYIWPEYSFMQIFNWPMNILTLGWWERSKKAKWEQFLESGDFSVWPFSTKEEFSKAASRPKYLSNNTEQEIAKYSGKMTLYHFNGQ